MKPLMRVHMMSRVQHLAGRIYQLSDVVPDHSLCEIQLRFIDVQIIVMDFRYPS